MIDADDGTGSVSSASKILSVAPTIAPPEDLCVDPQGGGRVFMADLSLHMGNGGARLEHQRDEGASKRMGADRRGSGESVRSARRALAAPTAGAMMRRLMLSLSRRVRVSVGKAGSVDSAFGPGPIREQFVAQPRRHVHWRTPASVLESWTWITAWAKSRSAMLTVGGLAVVPAFALSAQRHAVALGPRFGRLEEMGGESQDLASRPTNDDDELQADE